MEQAAMELHRLGEQAACGRYGERHGQGRRNRRRTASKSHLKDIVLLFA
jgi:hypothetical protein